MNFIGPNLYKPIFQIFPEKAVLISQGKCPECKKPIFEKDFTDELSIKEYSVSGMCQKCQNKVWG